MGRMNPPRLAALLPPPDVLRYYALGLLPLVLVYLVAVETDGVWSRGFNLWSALHGMAQNIGPALLLLLGVWPFTGWMAARGFSARRQLLNHAGMALVFAVTAHGLTWGVIALRYSVAAAEGARANWFLWQSMWLMMMYWAAAGGFSAYRAIERAREAGAAAAQAQALLAQTELAALRNKLNPHFLFNTLHSILALVRKEPKRAEAALHRFSDMLRYVLDTERSGHDQVLLRDELAFTEQYLALEALRLGERLRLDWDVDEDALRATVPALTVQPLVENSLKHAFNPRSTPGTLRVAVRCEGDRLHIEVADDGPGCTLPADGGLPAGTGLGLPTVQRRLALRYGAAAQFELASSPGQGFAVRLQLPVTAPESAP